MTIKQAKTFLQRHNMVLKYYDGEYRVNFKHGTEETAYYTNDINDAINTAIVMAIKETV